METTKTRKLVLSAALAALGMILGLLEIPYPLAPWLNLDLSEIVVIMAISMLGFKSALFVCVCKFFVSILFKGPVGPIAIGQITALIASLTICCVYYYLSRHLKLQKEWQSGNPARIERETMSSKTKRKTTKQSKAHISLYKG